MAGQINRVLIAGGTGLIGNNLTKALLAAGKEVWILSRSPSEAKAPVGAQLVAWDGRTTEGWLHLIDQVDALVHLAGTSIGGAPWTEGRRQAILESRVEAGQALAGAVRASSARPMLLVQASAIGYYGTSEQATFTETDPAGDDWLAAVCLAWEHATQEVEELGMRRVIIRTGLVLDRRQGILPQMTLPVRLGVGGRIGNGRQWLSWIHIDDEIQAILRLMEDDSAHGAYNLTAPTPQNNAEFTRALAQALHRPYWLPIPALAIRLALGKMSKLVLEGQEVLPKRLQEAGFTFQYPELDGALSEIYSK
jgi:uncharacterized protein